MSPTNAWTDERIDDFMAQYRRDREADQRWQQTMEKKLDDSLNSKRITPALVLSAAVPLCVAIITSVALVLTNGPS